MSRICVKNISKNTSEVKLRDLFGSKGEITDIRIAKTKSGKSRQFAFIGYRDHCQAQDAIAYFNGTFIDNSKVVVEPAKRIGDATLVDGARSRHTKAKLEKEAKTIIQKKRAERQLQKLNSEKKTALKKNELNILHNQDKIDFMESMKRRRSANRWGNDELQNSTPFPTPSYGESVGGEKPDNSSSDGVSDADEEDVNYFPNCDLPVPAETISEIEKKKALFSEKVSDLDYLKSKIKSNLSDSDSDDDDDDSPVHKVVLHKISENIMENSKVDENNNTADFGSGRLTVVGGDEDKTNNGDIERPTDVQAPQSEDQDEGDEDESRLFIRNLPYGCSEEELTELFRAYGPITETHVPLDAEKKGKGFAFVQFMIPEHASKACSELDGTSFQGRLMHVMRAKRSRGGGDGDGDGVEGPHSTERIPVEEGGRAEEASGKEGELERGVR